MQIVLHENNKTKMFRSSSVVAFAFILGLTSATRFPTRHFESRKERVSETWLEVSRRNASLHVTGSRICHGDINRLHPTGKATGGVRASQTDVEADIPELKKRWAYYQTVADSNCLQASLIAAIASRESKGGADLYQTYGYGDFGRAYGILQCDLKHSDLPCLSYVWYSLGHIQMMISRQVVPYISQIQRKFPHWTIDQSLQGGVAAYNKGVSRVTSWPDVDQGTAHNDYSNDVIARAQHLYTLGWN